MAKIGEIYYGRLSLFKNSELVDNPTIAAGDVTVVKADGSVANIATLPAVNVSDTRIIEFALSALEMVGSVGQSVTVLFEDQADDEWEPIVVDIPLDAYNLADMADVIWDEILTGATHNVSRSAGRRLRQLADVVIIDGLVVSATENTVTLDAEASDLDGAYDPALIYISSGLGAGQCRLILQYDGATRTCWVDRDWKYTPAEDDEYVIIGDSGREHVNEGHAQSGGTNWIQLNVLASDVDDAYNGQVVFIRSGTGEDQARRIIDYDGSTHIATVSPAWDVTPDTTSAGAILPTAVLTNDYLGAAVWTYATRTLTSFGTLVADIWAYTSRTLTSFGTLIADIWAYASRTLTSIDLQAIASAVWRYARRSLTLTATELSHLLTPSAWTLYRGTTWDEDVELNVNLSTLDEDGEIWFTYKRKPETDGDDDALLQVSYHDGLTRLNGTAVDTEDNALAAITIVNAVEGTVNLYISETITAQLELMTRGYFDFKVRLDGSPDNVQLHADGRLRVYRDVTRAV